MNSEDSGEESINDSAPSRDMDLTWTLNVKGVDRTFQGPLVMGILNVTPDSFADGGQYVAPGPALERIGEMVEDGAAIIDIGGESTRPGAEPVSEDEELKRVLPVLEQAIPEYPDTYFSVDTTKLKVAHQALYAGAHIINDVSGLTYEPKIAGLCADYGAAYVLMHKQGTPKDMQDNPAYEDVVADIKHFFIKQMALTEEWRLNRDSIILDPGIGFGKTLEHNLELLRRLREFGELGRPLLIGASRKSMISKILDGRTVEERLAGTIAVHYHALLEGAKILRVHDVRDAADSVEIYKRIVQSD